MHASVIFIAISIHLVRSVHFHQQGDEGRNSYEPVHDTSSNGKTSLFSDSE